MPCPGRWLLFLCLVVCAPPLTSCGALVASAPPVAPSPAPLLPTPAPSPLPALRVVFTERDAGNVMLWVAYGLGLFRQHGLEVTLTQEPDRAALDELVAGQTDVVVGNGASALVAAAGGADVRFVAGLLNSFPYRLLVDPAVETPADLRGGRLGVGRPGSASEVATRLALRELELEPGKDVQLLQVSAAQERQAALENGAILGAAVVPPETVFLERLDFHSLLDFGPVGAEGPARQVVVAARLLQERPTLVQRFVDTLVEATALAKRDPAVARRVLAEYLHVSDDAALDDTYDLFVRQLAPRAPYPATAGSISRFLPLLADTDPDTATLDPIRLSDRHFVQQALDNGLGDQPER
ncbi:MAG TPA: ABC transporter substrate-binding protein [Chloroflexota bacterium]|nr:ABC transporter substrate-binding protein [Chloroflexota bacterium]